MNRISSTSLPDLHVVKFKFIFRRVKLSIKRNVQKMKPVELRNFLNKAIGIINFDYVHSTTAIILNSFLTANVLN